MNKKRVIVVCPGRGSYTRDTKGYVSEFGGPAQEYIKLREKEVAITTLNTKSFERTFENA